MKEFKNQNRNLVDVKLSGASLVVAALVSVLLFNGCGSKAETKPGTVDNSVRPAENVRVRENVATFLGNASRSNYGSGPWAAEPLQVLWSIKTGAMAGPNHKVAWGGSAWPG